MLRLNGDINRQLSNILKVSFKQKYKKEIKERLLFFVNITLKDIKFEDFHIINNFIQIDNNQISIIKKNFFDLHKEDLLNSFNSFWYSVKNEYKPTKQENVYFKSEILNVILSDFKIFSFKNNLFLDKLKEECSIIGFKDPVYFFFKKTELNILKYKSKYKFILLKSTVNDLFNRFLNYFNNKIISMQESNNDFVSLNLFSKNLEELFLLLKNSASHFKLDFYLLIAYKYVLDRLNTISFS